MSLDTVYCSDLPNAPSCCFSCHEDHDEWGYSLCGADGFEVCCFVNGWLIEALERK